MAEKKLEKAGRPTVHLVLVPSQADSLAVLLRRVHGRYMQYLNVKKQPSGHLWQNRYFSCPLSESHLGRVLRYVEWNPVRAGLAAGRRTRSR